MQLLKERRNKSNGEMWSLVKRNLKYKISQILNPELYHSCSTWNQMIVFKLNVKVINWL